MRDTLRLIFILLIVFCCNSSGNSNLITDRVDNSELLSIDLIETSNLQNPSDSLDCVFDQNTQTDEFLRNIPELKPYEWDQNSQTATVILDTRDTLFITRGGCAHFGVSAEFRLKNDKANYSDWNEVYKKILWIAELLKSEFMLDDIKNAINTDQIAIEKYDNIEVVYFNDEYLRDNHYEIMRKVEVDETVLSLSYYIN